MQISRREILAAGVVGGMAPRVIASGSSNPFTATWNSLSSGYRVPDWFGRAKFGIWSHWSAQCVPEAGDWYGRLMYVQGHPAYAHHLSHFGHPSRTGFMEIQNLWTARHWDPDALISLYKSAGARYFMALGCHHDNLDAFNSRNHAWNVMRVGPRQDIVGGWAIAARKAGLRFAISNHSSHSWHWYQTAYGYDAEGLEKGKRYDAWNLTRSQGAGKWWDGLDPQELYNGPYYAPPAGIDSLRSMNAWHDAHDGEWTEAIPPGARGSVYARKWLMRQMDLVEQYRPDMVYLDDSALPFGSIGLEAAAHYYNQASMWHGRPDVVLTAKKLSSQQRRAIVEDVERGFVDAISPRPWQTDTCIGDWHYDRTIFTQHRYKSAETVLQRLCDVVSKNGNLMLSIPIRGDGTHDQDELDILGDLALWFRANGDGIYNTVPWRTFGEGPTLTIAGTQNENLVKAFTDKDIRFTVSISNTSTSLNAFFLGRPRGAITIASLGTRAIQVEAVALLRGERLEFTQSADGLTVALPENDIGIVAGVRIEGRGIS